MLIYWLSIFKRKPSYMRQKMDAYYEKLIKASAYLSIVPTILILLLILFHRLTILEAIICVILVFIISLILARPYLDDLSELTNYVDGLSSGSDVEPPSLGYISNVEQLSKSVSNLNKTWLTKTHQLKVALAESSILFDTIPDILIMVDKDLSIVRANNSAVKALGRRIKYEKFTDVFDDKTLGKKIKNVVKCKKGGYFELHTEIQKKEYDFQVFIERFPVRSESGSVAIIIMHDYTEEKRRKKFLKDFVANASHEIRTPLTSIIGFVENLQTLDANEDDPLARKKVRDKFIGIINDQALKMLNLLNDLLSLSKAEMEDDQSNIESVSVNEIINNSCNRLSHMASGRDINFKKILLNKDFSIETNKNDLYQILTNLLSNAIKYSPNNSSIAIRSRIVRNNIYNPNKSKNFSKLLLISVIDKGEGIDKNHISRITERFYRVDRRRSKKIDGTGLGLAIVKNILSKYHGDLVIESEYGKGSIFTARIPFN